MAYKGRLKIAGEPGEGIPVDLSIDDVFVDLASGDEDLGRWRMDVVSVSRLAGNEFSLILDGENMVFVAADPLGFAYNAVITIEEIGGRLQKKRGLFRKRTDIPRRPVPTGEAGEGEEVVAQVAVTDLEDLLPSTPDLGGLLPPPVGQPPRRQDVAEPVQEIVDVELITQSPDTEVDVVAQQSDDEVAGEVMVASDVSEDFEMTELELLEIETPAVESEPSGHEHPVTGTPPEVGSPTVEPARDEHDSERGAGSAYTVEVDLLPGEVDDAPEPEAVDVPADDTAPNHIDRAGPSEPEQVESARQASGEAALIHGSEEPPSVESDFEGAAACTPGSEVEQAQEVEDPAGLGADSEREAQHDQEVPEEPQEEGQTGIPEEDETAAEAVTRAVDVEASTEADPALPGLSEEPALSSPDPVAASTPVVTPQPKRRRFGRSRSEQSHVHEYVESKTVGGITRRVCGHCGHVSFAGEDVYEEWK